MGREKDTSQPTTKPCKNCGRPAVSNRSRCPGCYTYWRTHQAERPGRLYGRKLPLDRIGKPAWCEVCGDTNVLAGGKCSACYKYWLKYKKKRPRHRWDPEYRCKTCGIPLAVLDRQANGRCNACYMYRSRHGADRPRELWGDGPHGFCECGYPAVALVEDIPVCVRHRE